MKLTLVVAALLVLLMSCAQRQVSAEPAAVLPPPPAAENSAEPLRPAGQVSKAERDFYSTFSAYEALVAYRQQVQGLLTIAGNKDGKDFELVEKFFGEYVTPEEAKQILESLLHVTEDAIETNKYVSAHGLGCYYGDLKLCLKPELHK